MPDYFSAKGDGPITSGQKLRFHDLCRLPGKRAQLKKNPLKNLGVMLKLNPHAKSTKRAAILAMERSKENRAKAVDKKRKAAGKK